MNNSQIKDLALKVVADECRRNFFFFVQTFWDIIIKETPVYNWHIPYLCDELQKLSIPIFKREAKPYDLLINIPPGTTKSTIVTIMWPVWLWTNDATLRIITNSYSGTLAIDHATKSKDILQSDKFLRLFPDIRIRKDKAGKQNYQNTQTGYRYATSTGATITGFHAHVIINDDPQNPKQAYSTPLRLQANEHTKTLSSRKVNKANTPVVTIMQRLHEEDVTGYLLKRKSDDIKHICLPAEDCEYVNPPELRKKYVNGLLDANRLNRKVLDEALVDLGSHDYAGQYMQLPTTMGGNIIKQDWFNYITAEMFERKRYQTKDQINFFIDTAYTERTSNDPTGIIGACTIGNDLYITCAEKVNMKFPDLVRHIPTYVKKNGYTRSSSVRIEPKANGLSVIDQLRETTNLNVVSTPSPKEGKEVRLHAASPFVEGGHVYLVKGLWNEMFVDEICGFPAKPHDEFVDLLCYAIDYHHSNQYSVSDEEIENDFY